MKSLLNKIKSIFSFNQKKAEKALIEAPQDPVESDNPWWGTFLMDEEQSRFFKIGNIVVCLDRYNQEWQVTTHREGEKPFKSFAAQASNEIILKPALPDRALLAQLDRPIYVPSGESLLLFISSPLWIRMEAGKPPILLDTIPTETLADTWFGHNTLEGELCYAGETICSPRLDDLHRDNTHVTTPILFENRSKETVMLEKLKIPLPYLSVFSDTQNFLWTEQLSVHQENDFYAEINILKGFPKNLKEAKFLSPARHQAKSGFKDLFSPFKWK